MNEEPHKPQRPIRRTELAWAVEQLAKALGERSDCEVYQLTSPAEKAQKYILEFFGQFNSSDFTEDEADWSQACHSYLRKGCDDPISSLIYRMVDTNRGMQCWRFFIRMLMQRRFSLAELRNFEALTDDDFILRHAILGAPLDHWKYARSTLSEWGLKPIPPEKHEPATSAP